MVPVATKPLQGDGPQRVTGPARTQTPQTMPIEIPIATQVRELIQADSPLPEEIAQVFRREQQQLNDVEATGVVAPASSFQTQR